MTDRTLRISARMAEEIQQWASDELSQWPRDTAYAADLENLLSQLTAAAPAPDAVARLAEAATVLGPWISASLSDPHTHAGEDYTRDADAFLVALAAMEASHDRT